PGEQVGGPGPQRGQTDAGPARHATVKIGHECRTLLVMAQDELDRRVEQRDHDVPVLLAGYPEDVLDAFCLEAAQEQVTHLHADVPPSAHRWITLRPIVAAPARLSGRPRGRVPRGSGVRPGCRTRAPPGSRRATASSAP